MYRIFKNTVIVLGLIAGIGMISCEQEVEKPKAKFYIEVLDSSSGAFKVLNEPYNLSVNQEFTVYSDNDA